MSKRVKKALVEVGDHKIWLSWNTMVGLYDVLEGILVQGGYFDEDNEDNEEYEFEDEEFEDEDRSHKVDYDDAIDRVEMFNAIKDSVVDERSEEEREMIGKIDNVCGGMSKDFDKVLEGSA